MPRTDHLIKGIVAACVPALLIALLAFQVHRYKWTLILRNHYLVENIPQSSSWVWNALSEDVSLQQHGLLAVNGVGKATPFDHNTNFSIDRHRQKVLLPELPSLTVHYIWCIDGHFELSNYLSILSILKQLQPDSIVIHYRTHPRHDPKGYWRWLEDLERDVILLSLQPLKDPKYCSHTSSSGISSLSKDFPDPHGVFILGNVAVYNLTRAMLVEKIKGSYSGDSLSNKFESRYNRDPTQAQVFLVEGSEAHDIRQGPGHVVIKCTPMTEFNFKKNDEISDCIDMNAYITPENTHGRDSRFYRFARTMLFDNPQPAQVALTPVTQIPNSVHIILNNGEEITPLVYASIKSAYVTGHIDQVYLHGPHHPKGPLWDRLLGTDELKPTYIPTANFEKYSLKNGNAVYALYNLLLHGGVTHQGDVIFVKPFPSSLLKAPAVASPHLSQYRMKHKSVNTALLASSKGSQFIESLLAMVKQSQSSWPDADIDDIAAHLEESHPSQLLLDGSLISHQKCKSQVCQVAGGHMNPEEAYTTRFLWANKQPETLEEFKRIESSARNLLIKVIDTKGHSTR